MHKNIAMLCIFGLLCACAPSPIRHESGLFGRFPENYINPETGFTLWMPPNMHARQGMYAYVVDRQIKYCVNGNFRGTKYDNPGGDIYKILPDGTRIYAYYYYNEDVKAGVDAPAFNLEPTQIKVYYKVIFNMSVNKDGIITGCKYKRIQS